LPRLRLTLAPSAVALALSCGVGIADDNNSKQLRQLIDEQVGGRKTEGSGDER
jgi:hypothetical protein